MKIGEVIEIEERQPLWLPCSFHGKNWTHPRYGCLQCYAEQPEPAFAPEPVPEPAEVPAGPGH